MNEDDAVEAFMTAIVDNKNWHVSTPQKVRVERAARLLWAQAQVEAFAAVLAGLGLAIIALVTIAVIAAVRAADRRQPDVPIRAVWWVADGSPMYESRVLPARVLQPDPLRPVPAGTDWRGERGIDAIEARFAQGYIDGRGEPGLLAHFVNVVVPCESRWDTHARSAAGHLGLAQFDPASWEKAGGGDWTDPYQQGRNVARWASMTVSSEQWSCW